MTYMLFEELEPLTQMMHSYALLCRPRSLAPLHILTFCICSNALMAHWHSSITFDLDHQHGGTNRILGREC
jgi:hypothetical protein